MHAKYATFDGPRSQLEGQYHTIKSQQGRNDNESMHSPMDGHSSFGTENNKEGHIDNSTPKPQFSNDNRSPTDTKDNTPAVDRCPGMSTTPGNKRDPIAVPNSNDGSRGKPSASESAGPDARNGKNSNPNTTVDKVKEILDDVTGSHKSKSPSVIPPTPSGSRGKPKAPKKVYEYEIEYATLSFDSYSEGLWNNVDVFLRLNVNEFVTQPITLRETTTYPIHSVVDNGLSGAELNVLEYNHIDGTEIDYKFQDYEGHIAIQLRDWKDDPSIDSFCSNLTGRGTSGYTKAKVDYVVRVCKRLKSPESAVGEGTTTPPAA